MSKAIIPLEEALWVADRLRALIDKYCDKVGIAGSIRRREPFVGDIEIVCQPKVQQIKDLFGNQTEDNIVSFANIQAALGDLGLKKVKGKSRYQQWIIPYSVSGWQNQEINLDLFFVHPSAVTHGGYLPRGHRIEEGRIINGYTQEKAAEINTEPDYFKFCGLDFIPPEKRSAAVLSR